MLIRISLAPGRFIQAIYDHDIPLLVSLLQQESSKDIVAERLATPKGNLTPLHYAAYLGREDIVRALLERFPDLDVDVRDILADTPFTPLVATDSRKW